MKNFKQILAISLVALLFIAIGCTESTVTPILDNVTQGDSNTVISPSGETLKKIMAAARDSESGEPMENVTVLSLPSRTQSVTNAEGKCWFHRPVSDTLIVFSKAGFENISVPLKSQYEIVGANFSKK